MKIISRFMPLAACAAVLIAAGGAIAIAPAVASGFGSIVAEVDAPGAGPINGYCLSAAGSAGKFTTAPSGTDGNTGEINQATVASGSYKGFIYDCGGGGGYTSQQITFSVTANIQTNMGTYLLQNGASMYGQVLDSSTGAGAPYVTFRVFTATRSILLGSACTDSGGNYSMGGLPTSGVKIEFGGSTCPDDGSYATQWYDGASTYATATIVDATTACCGFLLNTVTLADKTSSKNGSVTITGVTISGSSTAPEFTVSGSGFGAGPGPHVNPPCPEVAGAGKNFGSNIYLNDYSGDSWQAGTGGDCIGLVIVSWSATNVVFTLGSWYATAGAEQGTVLNEGDPYTMTLKGAHFTGLVSFA